MIYDIAIMGAGPSGAALAARLNPRFKTIILEKRDLSKKHSEYREKPCGGLLNPDAQKYLAESGWALPVEILENPQLFSVRTMDMDNKCEQFYQRYYYNMNRALFEQWMVSHIPESVQIEDSALMTAVTRENESYRIFYRQKGEQKSFQCRLLIGCDGAGSRTRRLMFPEAAEPVLYASIQEWFPAADQIPYYGAVFDSEVTDFYSWTITKGDSLIVGSALPWGKGARKRFRILKRKLAEQGFPVSGTPHKREGALIYRPTRTNHIQITEDRTALTGEAAGFISPSSAEGFSYALKSASLLSESLNAHGAEKKALQHYKKRCRGLITNILIKNIKSPGMYYPPIRRAVLKSGIGGLNSGYSMMNSERLPSMASRCS